MEFEKFVKKHTLIKKGVILQDKNTILKFVNFLKRKNFPLVFRGEKLVFAQPHQPSFDISKFQEELFFIGCKGEHFWKKRTKSLKTNITQTTIKTIFGYYTKVFSNMEKINSKDLKQHIESFYITNEESIDFFLKPNNAGVLYNAIKKLTIKEKHTIVDYYMGILHTIGRYANSDRHQISTSTTLDTANYFSNNGVVIVSWCPPMVAHIGKDNIDLIETFLKSQELPTFQNYYVYPEQKETILKYGILPHYILGVIYNTTLYVNYNFHFDSNLEEIAITGCKIDQSDFEKIISKSKYKRSFFYIDDIVFLEEDLYS